MKDAVKYGNLCSCNHKNCSKWKKAVFLASNLSYEFTQIKQINLQYEINEKFKGSQKRWKRVVFSVKHKNEKNRSSILSITFPFPYLLAGPAYWRIWVWWHPSSLCHWWSCAALAWPRRSDPGPRSPRRRSAPESRYSSAAREAWFCPDHRRPEIGNCHLQI